MRVNFLLILIKILFIYNFNIVGQVGSIDTLLSLSEYSNSYELYPNYGEYISNAGDLNNDGISDYLVSANDVVFIYLGNEDQINIQTIEIRKQSVSDFPRGMRTQGIGDYNGDGFDDFTIYDSYRGFVFLYYGGIAVDTTYDLEFNGSSGYAYNVEPAGDFNNDGFDDFLVGYYNANGGCKAFLYLGNDLNNISADLILTDPEESIHATYFSHSMSSAGDINKDGYDDIIIGAPYYGIGTYPNLQVEARGRAYIYLGNSTPDRRADLIITGSNFSEYLGGSVSGGGDINKDGFSDFVIGTGYNAVDYSQTYPFRQLLVFYGSRDLHSNPDLIIGLDSNIVGNEISNNLDLNGDGYSDIVYNNKIDRTLNICLGSNLLENSLISKLSKSEDEYFSKTFTSIEDLNQDGFSDMITRTNYGIEIILGNDEKIGNDTFTFSKKKSFGNFGHSLDALGDINGDEFNDFAISLPEYENYRGAVFIYFGGLNFNGNKEIKLVGENTGDYFGSCIKGAKDLNNDGFADFMISASGFNDGDGKLYIYWGSRDFNGTIVQEIYGEVDEGLGSSIAISDLNNDNNLDLLIGSSSFDNDKGMVSIYLSDNQYHMEFYKSLIGEKTGDLFGYSISVSKDPNNHLQKNIFIGAPGYKNSNFDYAAVGRIYIIEGFENSTNSLLTGSQSLYGEYLGYSIDADGDFNGDGKSDILIGAYGKNEEIGACNLLYGGENYSKSDGLIFTGDVSIYFRQQFGRKVCYLSDINSDGFDDILISSPLLRKSYIYLGNNNNHNNEDYTLQIKDASWTFGYNAAFLGDVNGDGKGEILISDQEDSNLGKCYIFTLSPVSDIPNENIKHQFYLEQNYPNPFNPNTTIEFKVPYYSYVKLQVFNSTGQLVSVLIDEKKSPGYYKILFKNENLSSGVYYYKITINDFVQVKKMQLLK